MPSRKWFPIINQEEGGSRSELPVLAGEMSSSHATASRLCHAMRDRRVPALGCGAGGPPQPLTKTPSEALSVPGMSPSPRSTFQPAPPHYRLSPSALLSSSLFPHSCPRKQILPSRRFYTRAPAVSSSSSRPPTSAHALAKAAPRRGGRGIF